MLNKSSLLNSILRSIRANSRLSGDLFATIESGSFNSGSHILLAHRSQQNLVFFFFQIRTALRLLCWLLLSLGYRRLCGSRLHSKASQWVVSILSFRNFLLTLKALQIPIEKYEKKIDSIVTF